MRSDSVCMSGRGPGDGVRKHVPLRQDEVQALLDGDVRKLAGDKKAMVLLLNRVAATLHDTSQRVASLTMELDRLRQDRAQAAHPLQRALDAIAALDDEQKREILDRNYLSAMDQLQEEKRMAELARTAAHSATNRVRYVLGTLLQQDLPVEARLAVEAALSELGPL